MNTKNIFKHAFSVLFVMAIGASAALGQGIFDKIKDKVKNEAKTQTNNQTKSVTKGSYCFARIEVRVSWKDFGRDKYETRVYYSNVGTYKSGDGKMVENLAKYFEDGVANPLKERGIELKFYDSDIKIFPASYAYETTDEAEKEMDEQIEADKSNKFASIYTFVWKYNEKASGEEMTQPKRIFSLKPAPAAENKKAASFNFNE